MDKTLRCCMRMNWPVKIYISSIIKQSITLGNVFSTNIFRLEHAPASDLDVVFIFKGFKDVSFAERPNNITKRNV